MFKTIAISGAVSVLLGLGVNTLIDSKMAAKSADYEEMISLLHQHVSIQSKAIDAIQDNGDYM